MTVDEAMHYATHSLKDNVDVDYLFKNIAQKTLRDISRRIERFQMASVSNMTGTEDDIKSFLKHPSVVFSKEIGSHVDGCLDIVFEGLKDSSKENKHKQFLAYRAGEPDIRVMVRDIVDTKFNGSWSAFFLVIISETAHGYQHPEGYRQGVDVKEIDEDYLYSMIDNQENWFKEPVTTMIANILECVALALKEVRSVSS